MTDITWRDGATDDEAAAIAAIDDQRRALRRRRQQIANRARMRAVYRLAKKNQSEAHISVASENMVR